MLARKHQRPAADEALQFTECDDRAGERYCADRHAERHLDEAAAVDRAAHPNAVGFREAERRRGDADGGEADEAVKCPDELRQRRHLDTQCDHGADRAADQDADYDEPEADDVRGQQRRHDGDHHAGDAVEIAGPRRLRRRQATQRHDEADRRDQIEKGGEALAHRGARYRFLWNICSMRWVTMKPPKMLTAASVTATKPMTLARLTPSGPAAINAPTMITLEIALVTLISGECSAGVTRHTT